LDKPLPDKPSTNVEPKKFTHGGARPGAGWPKGKKWPSTLRKKEARERVRCFITERLGEFLEAMVDNVTGIKHLMMRDPKTGKFERITGDANVPAFTDLLNRAIDKPAEHIQVAGEGSITIRWQRD
jgi:hypothetical protein